MVRGAVVLPANTPTVGQARATAAVGTTRATGAPAFPTAARSMSPLHTTANVLDNLVNAQVAT